MMNHALMYISKGLIWTALILIVMIEVQDIIHTRIDDGIYEEMARVTNCKFLASLASRHDVGVFQCDGDIVLKKLDHFSK